MPVQVAERKGSIREFQILEKRVIPNFNTRDTDRNIYRGMGDPCVRDILARPGDLYYDDLNEVLYGYSIRSLDTDIITTKPLYMCSRSREPETIETYANSYSVASESYIFYFEEEYAPHTRITIPPEVGDFYKLIDELNTTGDNVFQVTDVNINPSGYGNIRFTRMTGTTYPYSTFLFDDMDDKPVLQRVGGGGDNTLRYFGWTIGHDIILTGETITLQPGGMISWYFPFEDVSTFNFFTVAIDSAFVATLPVSDIKVLTSHAGQNFFNADDQNEAFVNMVEVFNFSNLKQISTIQDVDLIQDVTSCNVNPTQNCFHIRNDSTIENFKFTLSALKRTLFDGECCWQPISKIPYFENFTIPTLPNSGSVFDYFTGGLVKRGWYQFDVFIALGENFIVPAIQAETINPQILQVKLYTDTEFKSIDISGSGTTVGGDVKFKFFNNSLQGSITLPVSANDQVNRKLQVRVSKANGDYLRIDGGYVDAKFISYF